MLVMFRLGAYNEATVQCNKSSVFFSCEVGPIHYNGKTLKILNV